MAVDWGPRHREISVVPPIGVDEIPWQRGHRYTTVVYLIAAPCRLLLWVRLERENETLEALFDQFYKRAAARLRFVCSDIWKAYLKVVQARAAQALHVLDPHPIVAKLNRPLDEAGPGQRVPPHRGELVSSTQIAA